MGCCCSCLPCCNKCKVKDAEAKFKPNSERGCTDILFYLLFWAAWAAIIFVIIWAYKQGADPRKLQYGTDYLGRVCGKDDGVSNLPYAAWPWPTEYKFRVCLESCDKTQTDNRMLYSYVSTKFLQYCVPDVQSYINQSAPTGSVNVQISLSGDYQTASEQASRAMNDMATTWPLILGSAGIALICCFIFAALSRRLAGVLVWGTIVLVLTGGFLLGYTFSERSAEATASNVPDRAKAMRTLSYIAFGVTGVFGLIILALREQISIAIEVVKESGAALNDIRSILCFPVIPIIIFAGVLAFFIATSLMIFSVLKTEATPFPTTLSNPAFGASTYWGSYASTTYNATVWDEKMKPVFAFSFFHLLWQVQFLIYFGYFVIAGAIAQWYFTRYEANGSKKLPTFPVLGSVWRALRYHMGTIALCSMIIAIIQFVRACVAYIEQKVSGGKKAEEQNKLQRAIFCMIHCCLWCAECCMDKINKNSLVWTAIFGDGFCSATCSSFSLIWANILRAAAINMVGGYITILGRLLVAMGTTGICGVILMYTYKNDEIASPIMPLVCIFLFSFCIASLFMIIFEVTIDTIFLCFLIDDSKNKDNMYASEALQKVVGRYSKQSEAEGTKLKEDAENRRKLLGKPKNEEEGVEVQHSYALNKK